MVESLEFRKNLDVSDVKKPHKFEGFNRKSGPKPFKTMFP